MSNEKILLPRDFYAMLDKHVVGQEHAKHVLGAAAYVHTSPTREKSPRVLIMGPSGTGKTALAKALAKEINAPFVFVNATEYSQTGYVGKDISSLANEINKVITEFKSKDIKKVLDKSLKNNKPNFNLPDLKFIDTNDIIDIFNNAIKKENAPLLNLTANIECLFNLFKFSENEFTYDEIKIPKKINKTDFTEILKDYAEVVLNRHKENDANGYNTKQYTAHKELIDAVKNNEDLNELSEKYLKIFYTYFKFLIRFYPFLKSGDINTLNQKLFKSELFCKMILNILNIGIPFFPHVINNFPVPKELIEFYKGDELEPEFKKFIDSVKKVYKFKINDKLETLNDESAIKTIYWTNYFLKKNLFVFSVYLKCTNVPLKKEINSFNIYDLIDKHNLPIDEIIDGLKTGFDKLMPLTDEWYTVFGLLFGMTLRPTSLVPTNEPSDNISSKLKNSLDKYFKIYTESSHHVLVNLIFTCFYEMINYLIFSNKSFYFEPEDILKLPEFFWFFANPKEDEIKKKLKSRKFQLGGIKSVAKLEVIKGRILILPANDNEIKRKIIRAEWLYQKLTPFFEIMIPDYLEKRKAIIEHKNKPLSFLSILKSIGIEETDETIKENKTKEPSVDAIVFIDEFDKIAIVDDKKDNVSSIGVQRDLLGVLDGTILKSEANIMKKIDDTPIDTSRILFICAGAFMYTSMDGIIDELKGRFTLITKTGHLNKEEYRKLVPKEIEFFNLNLNTSKINCSFVFTDEIIDLILETTFELNKKENLGVRRLKSIFQMLAGEKAFLIDYDKTIIITRSDIENVRDAILKTSSTKINQIGFV